MSFKIKFDAVTFSVLLFWAGLGIIWWQANLLLAIGVFMTVLGIVAFNGYAE